MSDNNSFTSHFVELRSRLIKSLVFILVIFVISYTFAEHIYSFLVNPYAEAVKDDSISRRLIFTALHETFITYLKVAFITLFNFNTDTFFVWRYVSLLFSYAISHKVFFIFRVNGIKYKLTNSIRSKSK